MGAPFASHVKSTEEISPTALLIETPVTRIEKTISLAFVAEPADSSSRSLSFNSPDSALVASPAPDQLL